MPSHLLFSALHATASRPLLFCTLSPIVVCGLAMMVRSNSWYMTMSQCGLSVKADNQALQQVEMVVYDGVCSRRLCARHVSELCTAQCWQHLQQ